MEDVERKLKEAGVSETEPRVYDTRDWREIESWADLLAKKSGYGGTG